MTKEHILDEIRRTAAENGGVAVGERRFETETSIRPSDWRGRYWARWGDAQREAGFGPSKWISAIPDDELFGKLAALARKLGRFPVESELRLHRRSEPAFPSVKAFRRVGSKADLVAAVRKHCLARREDDVAALCVVEPSERADVESATDVQLGFVYLLRSGRYHKIGKTNAVGRRERELAIQLPERSRVVHEIKTDDPAGIEDYWHRRFADRWKNGEWFELTAADVAAFRRRKFM